MSKASRACSLLINEYGDLETLLARAGEIKQPKRREPGQPLPMIACDLCGTHLPEGEAVKGTDGRYCCQEHRRQHEAPAR